LLEAEKWWKQKSQTTPLLLTTISEHSTPGISFFGHDPGAFHNKGEIGQEEDGRIFLIDVGMSRQLTTAKAHYY